MTPEELKKAQKALEAQLIGGVSTPSGVWYDEFGMPHISTKPTYYGNKVVTDYVKMGGITQKETLISQLAELKTEEAARQAATLGVPFDRKTELQKQTDILKQDYLQTPLVGGYGTFAEKAKTDTAPPMDQPAPAGYDVGLLTGMKRQQIAAKPVRQLNWDAVEQAMIQDGSLTPEQAKSEVKGLRAAYYNVLEQDPTLSHEQAFTKAFEGIAAIGQAPSLQSREGSEAFQQTTPADPVARAMSTQIKEGETILDLTPEQMAYQKAKINRESDKFAYQEVTKIKSEEVPMTAVTIDGAGNAILVPTEIVTYLKNTNRNTTTPIFGKDVDDQIRDAMTADSDPTILQKPAMRQALLDVRKYQNFGDPNAWWLDPEMKEKIMANPEEYVDEGWFTDIDQFGGTAETNIGWTLRSGLGALNLAAEAIQSEILEPSVGATMGLAAEALEAAEVIPQLPAGESYFDPYATTRIRRAQSEKVNPLYKDSPYAAAWALNKGFTGNAQELSDALNLEGWTKTGVVVGGFFLDLADPTPAVAIGLSKGGLAGSRMFKVQTSLLNATTPEAVRASLKTASKVGAYEFLNDLNGVSAIAKKNKKLGEFAKSNAGDVRLHISDEMAQNLRARQIMREAGQDGLGMDVAYQRILDEGLENTNFWKTASKQPTDNVLDAVKNTDDAVPAFQKATLKEMDDAQDLMVSIERAVDDFPNYKIDEFPDALTMKLDDLDDLAKARYNKPFLKLTAGEANELAPLVNHHFARRLTWEGTPDIALADDIVAISRNTWAHQDSVPAIIAEANKTALGKMLGKISAGTDAWTGRSIAMRNPAQSTMAAGADVLGETRAVAMKPKPHYVGDQLRNPELIAEVRQLRSLPVGKKEQIIMGLSEGQLSLEDFRLLVDTNTDRTALTLTEDYGITTMKNLDNLEDHLKTRVLDAQGRRTKGFFGELVSNQYQKLKKALFAEVKSDAPELGTTIQQKRMVREVSAEASTMDVKLQREVESIVNNEDVRVAFLGEEFRNVEVTREQALGAAIVGSKRHDIRLFDLDQRPITPDEYIAERTRLDADYEARVTAEKQRQETARTEAPEKKARAREEFATRKEAINENKTSSIDTINDAEKAEKQVIRDRAIADNNAKKAELAQQRQNELARAEALNAGDKAKAKAAKDEVKRVYKEKWEDYKRQQKAKVTEDLNKVSAEKEAQRVQVREKAENDLQTERDIRDGKITRAAKEVIKQPVTKEEIVIKATLEQAHQVGVLSAVGEWSMNRLFYSAKSKPKFIDRVTGANQIYANDLINAKGRSLFNDALDKFSLNAQRDPANFWFHFDKLRREYDQLLQDPTNLRPLVDPREIKRARMSTEEIVQEVQAGVTPMKRQKLAKRFGETDPNAQLNIGMYYFAEGTRIVDRKLVEATWDSVNNYNIDAVIEELALDAAMLGVTPVQLDRGFKQVLRQRLIKQLSNNTEDFLDAQKTILMTMTQNNPNLRAALTPAFNARTTEDFFKEITKAEQTFPQIEPYRQMTASLTRKSQEVADTILKNNGFDTTLVIDKTRANDIMDELLGVKNEQLARALVGNEKYDELKNLVGSSRVDPLTAALDDAIRNTTRGDIAWRMTKNFFGGAGGLFYLMVLGARPRFHINNIMSAPSISYQTTGMTSANNINKGRKVAFSTPSGNTYYEIAVTTPSGKQYTYGEIQEMLMSGGVRSEYSFVTSYLNNDDLIGWLGRNKVLGKKSLGWLNDTISTKAISDLTMKEDTMFRASNLLTDLERGKSVEEAVATARISMFDYNEMTATEKAIATSYLVFYSFTRANLMSYIDAFSDAKKMKRFMNVLKFDRGVEKSLEAGQQAYEGDPNLKWDPNIFIQDYHQPKIKLWKVEQAGKDYDLYYQSPNIPALDAIATLGAFAQEPLKYGYNKTATFLSPTTKAAVYGMFPDAVSGFDKVNGRVPDGMVAPLATYYDDPNDVAWALSWLSGGKVVPVPVSEGGVRGYIYPLTDEQAKTYQQRMTLFSQQGVMAPVTEFTNLFGTGAEESAMRQASPTGRLFGSPMKVSQRQDLYNLYTRRQAIQAEIDRLKALERKAKEAERQKQNK